MAAKLNEKALKILELLKEGDFTCPQMAKRMGLPRNTVDHHITVLRVEHRLIHICDWLQPPAFSLNWGKIYRLGPGPDVPHPESEEYQANAFDLAMAVRREIASDPFEQMVATICCLKPSNLSRDQSRAKTLCQPSPTSIFEMGRYVGSMA